MWSLYLLRCADKSLYIGETNNVERRLGHSSVRIAERHYKPWVKTPQKKLEEEVRKAWAK